MIGRLTAVLFVCSISGACTAKRPTANEATIPVPPFDIRITLSEAAARKLGDAGESIRGSVYFEGDGARKHHDETVPMRAVALGSYQFETVDAGIVSVREAVISEEAFKRLNDSNYYYTVNVFSGQRVFGNNILGGGYAAGRIQEAVKSPIEITCNLPME